MSMVSWFYCFMCFWFHRFRDVNVFMVSSVSWCQGSHGLIGFVVSMSSWFHRFDGVKGLVVLQGSWCQRFHGFICLLVSSSLPADVLWGLFITRSFQTNTYIP